jgi:hypothetical protein
MEKSNELLNGLICALGVTFDGPIPVITHPTYKAELMCLVASIYTKEDALHPAMD